MSSNLPERSSPLARPDNDSNARPQSVPPPLHPSLSESDSKSRPASRSRDTSKPRQLSETLSSAPLLDQSEPLDQMPSLKRAEPSIVKTRSGSVLSRGFILKTDHYPSGERTIDALQYSTKIAHLKIST